MSSRTLLIEPGTSGDQSKTGSVFRVSFESHPSEARVIAHAHLMADICTDEGLCYFIGGDVGAIKIGHSRYPEGRLKDMVGHSPIPLRILAVAQGGKLREQAYHLQFRIKRLHGEWFEGVPEIEAEITRLTAVGG